MLLLSVWKVEEGERARGKPDILARRKRKRGKNEGGENTGKSDSCLDRSVQFGVCGEFGCICASVSSQESVYSVILVNVCLTLALRQILQAQTLLNASNSNKRQCLY